MRITKQALAAALGLVALMAPRAVRADTTTYNFSGTLSGSGAVTGQFTLDAANVSITSFHFTTPLGDITTATSTANIYTYSPAYSPNSNFVEIEILPTSTTPGLNLNFEADVSNLTPTSFYPASFYPFQNVKSSPSQLMSPEGCTTCQEFTAGTVTVSKPAPAAKPDAPSRPNRDVPRKDSLPAPEKQANRKLTRSRVVLSLAAGHEG